MQTLAVSCQASSYHEKRQGTPESANRDGVVSHNTQDQLRIGVHFGNLVQLGFVIERHARHRLLPSKSKVVLELTGIGVDDGVCWHTDRPDKVDLSLACTVEPCTNPVRQLDDSRVGSSLDSRLWPNSREAFDPLLVLSSDNAESTRGKWP